MQQTKDLFLLLLYKPPLSQWGFGEYALSSIFQTPPLKGGRCLHETHHHLQHNLWTFWGNQCLKIKTSNCKAHELMGTSTSYCPACFSDRPWSEDRRDATNIISENPPNPLAGQANEYHVRSMVQHTSIEALTLFHWLRSLHLPNVRLPKQTPYS